MSEQVLPRENGVRYPWNFIFSKWFWKKKKISIDRASNFQVNTNKKDCLQNNNFYGKDNFKPAVEAISLDMKQQELDGRYIFLDFNALEFVNLDPWLICSFFLFTTRCMQIRNLHKVYSTRKGKCCAVNSLQLTLYENQILALLGESDNH